MNITKKTIELEIGQVKKDPKFRTRSISEYRVKKILELIETGYFPAPVQVVSINKIYFLIDGWHRLEAWERALPDGGEILVEVVDGLKDYKEMMLYAARQNDHGWPYTEEEKKSLLRRFTKDGVAENRAREALRISDKQYHTWGDIRVVEVGGKSERAKGLEKPNYQERAMFPEKTNESERAIYEEKPTRKERASWREKTRISERAIYEEKPKYLERTNGYPVLLYTQKLTEWIRGGHVQREKETASALRDLQAEIEIFLQGETQ